MEEMLPKTISKQACLERRVIRAQKEAALNCPRCNSINARFCYYNNYSLSQPRYFCKTCRRYWTEGGSLRNIPFGGSPRKNKRSSSSSTSSLSVSNKKLPDLVQPPPQSTSPNPKIREGHDLNLAFPSHDFKAISGLIQVPNFDNKTPASSSHLSALELLAGFSSKGMNNSFMPMQLSDTQNTICPSGFSLQEFKPNLNCSLDGLGNGGYGNLQGVED